jgi:hypothetical protein
MSGAPVWIGNRLIGIVNDAYDVGRLRGTRIAVALDDPSFASLLSSPSDISSAAGTVPPPAEFEPPPVTVAPEMSQSASEVLSLAAGLAGGARVDASIMLLAAFRHSYANQTRGVTPEFLNSLARRQRVRPEELITRLNRVLRFAEVDPASADPRLDEPPLSLLLGIAAGVAERVSGFPGIHLRHLVMAAVLASDPPLRPEFLAVVLGTGLTWLGRAREGLTSLRRIAADLSSGVVSAKEKETAADVTLPEAERPETEEGIQPAADEGHQGSAPPEPDGARPDGAILVEPHSELADSHREDSAQPPRPLSDPEYALLSELEVFVGTPREAKRMFNLYRMLRSTRDLSDAASFLGDDQAPGEYQAVAVLLGMLTAEPHLLGAVFDAPRQAKPPVAGGLMHRPESDRWRDLVADIAPKESGHDKWANQIIGPVPLDKVPGWQRFAMAARGPVIWCRCQIWPRFSSGRR